ncbi:ABC transporter substrate-binding protein [Nonomuraea sp. NPDC003804]|uniref:ABC transporter substrate-binding protein n=1 Tax=Nonomuraea sp. NPDC003804 TaxID=3154547 RepID=UPI00339E1F0D
MSRFAMLAAACLMLAACGTTTPTARPQPPSSAAAAEAGYPVTIRNCGKDYTFTAAPRRVVVMNGGSIGEVSSLLALGLGDRIVANAQSYGASDEPGWVEAVAALPSGGFKRTSFNDIPRESMLGLRPDFVLATSGRQFEPRDGFATREELRAAGAATYTPESTCGVGVRQDQSIEDSYTLLRDLGRIFHVSDRAEKLVAESRRRIAAVSAKVAGRPRPKVMLIIPGMSMGSNAFSSIGAKGIWNDIFAKAGAVNAFEHTSDDLFTNLSKEQVAATKVDAVVIVDWLNPDPDAEARKLFAQFPHWGRKYVVLADSAYVAPNNATAVEKIARVIHPEAF